MSKSNQHRFSFEGFSLKLLPDSGDKQPINYQRGSMDVIKLGTTGLPRLRSIQDSLTSAEDFSRPRY